MDTINASGGNAGLHHSVFKTYFEPLKEKGLKEPGMELAELTPAELEAIEEETTLNEKEAAR